MTGHEANTGPERRLPGFAPARAALSAWAAALLGGAVAVAQDATEPGTDQYYSGNALYNRKLYALATVEYRSFLEKHPNHSKADQARLGLALSLYAGGKYREAEPELNAVLRKGAAGDRHQLLLLRAQCLLEIGNVPEAEKAFGEAAQSAPAGAFRADALAGLAEIAFRQKKWADAASWSAQLLEKEPESRWTERALYQAAYARYEMKEPAAAVPLLDRLLANVRDASLETQGAFLLGEIHRDAGRLAEAAKLYARAAQGAEGEAAAEILYRLGYAQFAQAQYDEAADAFRKAIARKPAADLAAKIALLLGRCQIEKGDGKGAAETLRPVSQSPAREAAEATLWLARSYARQKKNGEAAGVLGPALAKFPKDPLLPDLLFDYANVLAAEQKYADAARPLSDLLRLANPPQRNDVLRLHAVCLHRTRDYAASLQSADAFLAAFPQDPLAAEVLFARAENLFFLNRLEEALAAYRKFLEGNAAHAAADSARFRVAEILQRQGKYAEALECAAPLLEKTPRPDAFAQLDFLAGDCLFKLGKWDEALARLAIFADANAAKRGRGENAAPAPNVDTALVEMGVASVKKGDPAQAAVHFSALVSRSPQSPHLPLALAELGRLRYDAGDFKSARESLERVVSAYPQSPQRPQAEYYLGWTALSEKKNDEAAQRFGAVVRSYPQDPSAPDAALQLGLLLLSQEKYREARETFQNLLRSYPQHPRLDLATFSLGVTCARQKDWREGATHLRTAAEKFPQSEIADRALYERAWCEKGLNRPQEAVKCYQQLLGEHPESDLAEKARTEMAELTFDAKQYDAVIAELVKSLETLKDDKLRERALYRLGTAHFAKGDFEQSAQTFETFLQTYPKSSLRASALFQAGESRMKRKETAAAQAHFESASRIESEPKIRESSLLRLGETQGLLGRWRESVSAYEELLRLFPNTRWGLRARFGLGWGLEKQGDFRRALVEYGKAVAAGGKEETAARSQFQIGECLFALKDYDKAVQELMRVSVNYPYRDWSSKALLEMGRALEAKGDATAAIARFKEVLQKYPKDDVAVVAKERLDALRRTQ